MTQDSVTRAAAYARYSSDNQRAESIEAQLHDIKEWAAQNNNCTCIHG
ncbi:MAG: recombinase family protein [Syntrophomonadaceae bacterium]